MRPLPLFQAGASPTCEWLFLDLNSYFASVEQQEKPELRGRPIGIVPALVENTCCIAASYEAKAYGVKTGMGTAEARSSARIFNWSRAGLNSTSSIISKFLKQWSVVFRSRM
jgi:nucleotidyltransferase/DNA polymerase involved in DNA repair